METSGTEKQKESSESKIPLTKVEADTDRNLTADNAEPEQPASPTPRASYKNKSGAV